VIGPGGDAPTGAAELGADDQELLRVRDRLEQACAAGDHDFDWLLVDVRREISERTRVACLEDRCKRECAE